MELKDNETRKDRCLYLGIDAGQTHTEAVLLGADGQWLAQGEGGSSHVHGANMEDVFRQALVPALSLLNLGMNTADVESIGIGVTGLGIPGKKEAVLSIIREFFPKAFVLMDNDAVVSHWGAAGLQDGTTLLAGTGTIIYGEYKGRTCRLGGYGYLFGDEGGGLWIGQQAIRSTIRAAEEGLPRTAIVKRIEDYFGVNSVRKIPAIIYSQNALDIKRIAELAKPICEEASRGDETAITIIKAAADELSNLTLRLLKQLDIPREVKYPVYRLGGIWNSGPILNDQFVNNVNAFYGNVFWPSPHYTPAEGASLMAKAKHRKASI